MITRREKYACPRSGQYAGGSARPQTRSRPSKLHSKPENTLFVRPHFKKYSEAHCERKKEARLREQESGKKPSASHKIKKKNELSKQRKGQIEKASDWNSNTGLPSAGFCEKGGGVEKTHEN